MYNFNEFDFKKVITEANRDDLMWGSKSSFFEEEKVSEDM